MALVFFPTCYSTLNSVSFGTEYSITIYIYIYIYIYSITCLFTCLVLLTGLFTYLLVYLLRNEVAKFCFRNLFIVVKKTYCRKVDLLQIKRFCLLLFCCLYRCFHYLIFEFFCLKSYTREYYWFCPLDKHQAKSETAK